ncbi:MAG: tripartite tricarboxylate transporter family receptor [Hyphomicrobiales bacterium]|jgi:tripartite-type tricarboxylate transporter receptor subunit TctC|nr:tripartite tricarboxylate transporter family receptor [Hyphomicrobiales bacterium]
MLRIFSAAAALLLAFAPASKVAADDKPASFFAGKVIRVLVGYPPGSTFDTYARILIRHMPRHVPGAPTMIVQNMPGAGGLTMTSYMANIATPDGLTLGMLNPVNTTEPLLNPDAAKFDPTKFNWLGSMNKEAGACAFWGDKIKTIDDLKTKQAVIGGTGPAAGSTLDAKTLQSIFGYDFRMVLGYPGLLEVRLAAEKGEVDGYCGFLVSSIKVDVWDQFKAGQFRVLMQTGVEKHPDLPKNIPNVFDLAPDEQSRQIMSLVFSPWAFGRPVMAPAGVPADRLAVLRDAFRATLQDSVFLDEARKTNLEIQSVEPEEISRLVAAIYATPKALVERTRKILGIDQR